LAGGTQQQVLETQSQAPTKRNGASHLTRSTPAFAQRATVWPLNLDGLRRSLLGGDGEHEVRRAPGSY
jgi:hypothetical protein